MNTTADAIITAARREVLRDPLARFKRLRVIYLRTCLQEHAILGVDRLWGNVVPVHRLSRDGEAAIELQIAHLEREIYCEFLTPDEFFATWTNYA